MLSTLAKNQGFIAEILKLDHFLMALLLLCIDERKITRYLACSTHNEMRQSVKIKRVMPLLCSGWLSVAAFVGDKGIDASDVPYLVGFCFVLLQPPPSYV